MKKILLMLFCAIILLTGCENKEDVSEHLNTIKTSFKEMENIKSGNIAIKVEMETKINDENINLNIPFALKFAQDDLGSKIKLSLEENLFINNIETYIESDNKNVKVYFPQAFLASIFNLDEEENQWLYLELNDSSLIENLNQFDNSNLVKELDVNSVNDKFSNIDLNNIIKSDNLKLIDTIDGVKHYEFIVNAALIQRLGEALGAQEQIDELDFKEELKIEIYINSNNILTKIYVDFLPIVNSSKTIDMTKFAFSIELKEINDAVVEIPEDIKANAQDIMPFIETFSDIVEY